MLGVTKEEILFMINKNNVLQNKITKESIFTALMILMEENNFKEISISEIAKKAGVSRMAFYRNYNVVEDIITSYINEFFEEYSKQILSFEIHDNYESVRLFFAYFRNHDQFINNLINSDLTNLLLEKGVEYFHSLSQETVCEKLYSPIKERYIIEFKAGGLFKVLIEWVKSGMKENDEDMSELVCDIIND